MRRTTYGSSTSAAVSWTACNDTTRSGPRDRSARSDTGLSVTRRKCIPEPAPNTSAVTSPPFAARRSIRGPGAGCGCRFTMAIVIIAPSARRGTPGKERRIARMRAARRPLSTAGTNGGRASVGHLRRSRSRRSIFPENVMTAAARSFNCGRAQCGDRLGELRLLMRSHLQAGRPVSSALCSELQLTADVLGRDSLRTAACSNTAIRRWRIIWPGAHRDGHLHQAGARRLPG